MSQTTTDSFSSSFFSLIYLHSLPAAFCDLQREAIQFAWELLTKVYGLPADRLYVTYFEGDESQGLAPDTEARDLWLEMGVKEDHLLTGDAKDNFWGKSEENLRQLLTQRFHIS